MTNTSTAAAEETPALVAELEAQGRFLEAVEVLTALEPARRDASMESRLLMLRHQAFPQLDRSQGRDPWPPVAADPFPGQVGVPEVAWSDLDDDVLGGALAHHGCLLVRGLLTDDRAGGLRRSIDRALAARQAASAGTPVEETSPWYEPFLPGVGKPDTYDAANHVRAVDAPVVFNDVLAALDERGVGRLVSTYFGERPALSINKCELRMVEPAWGGPDYHQDGAFLGQGIRTVNVWVSLSHCGVDAPGLAVVPQRLHEVLPVGQDGALFNWTVSPVTVDRELGDHEVARPVFAPGDALLFDHFLVHRTDNDEALTNNRYAIETWFFAPSAYPLPKDGEKKKARPQLPLVF